MKLTNLIGIITYTLIFWGIQPANATEPVHIAPDSQNQASVAVHEVNAQPSAEVPSSPTMGFDNQPLSAATNYYAGSKLPVEWSQQHGCGPNSKLDCDMVIQYATEGTLDPTQKLDPKPTPSPTPSPIPPLRDGTPANSADAATNRIPDNTEPIEPINLLQNEEVSNFLEWFIFEEEEKKQAQESFTEGTP